MRDEWRRRLILWQQRATVANLNAHSSERAAQAAETHADAARLWDEADFHRRQAERAREVVRQLEQR